MELETAMSYLVALALPLWLLVEEVIHRQRSSKQPAKRLELGKLSGKPASRAPAAAPRLRAMRVAEGRKTA
jgi:hypothetical protein